jgi:hypothetical protein
LSITDPWIGSIPQCIDPCRFLHVFNTDLKELKIGRCSVSTEKTAGTISKKEPNPMSDVSLIEIMDQLSAHVERADAEVLLAAALEQLQWPVQEIYTPEQTMAIGTLIADLQRRMLQETNWDKKQLVEEAVGPFIDGMKADLFIPPAPKQTKTL